MYWERAHPSESFVELERSGARLLRRWGRLGREGLSRIEEHKSPEEATTALERQVRGIEGRGYVPGYSHPELIAAIERSPDDDGPYLVYSDWLIERSDVRGELIRRMRERRDWAVRAWLEENAAQLAPRWWSRCATIEWRLGFASRIEISGLNEGNTVWLLRRMLAHPTNRFAREIAISHVRVPWHLSTWQEILSAPRPTLQTIRIRRCPSLKELAGIPKVVLED